MIEPTPVKYFMVTQIVEYRVKIMAADEYKAIKRGTVMEFRQYDSVSYGECSAVEIKE